MRTKSLLSFTVAALAIAVFAVGCQKPTETAEGHAHEGHTHKHDHPPHGPNGGHIFNFDSDELTGEWCKYPDNDVVRIYLLDGKGKSAKPLVVEKFTVTPLVGSEVEPFELEPEDVDAEGATDKFMLDDLQLLTAIPFGVEIEVVTEDKTMKGKIKAHKPRDH